MPTLDAAGILDVGLSGELLADAALDAIGNLEGALSAELAADATLDAAPSLDGALSGELLADALLDAIGILDVGLSGELDTDATLDADGNVTTITRVGPITPTTFADTDIIAVRPSVTRAPATVTRLNLCPEELALCLVRGDTTPFSFQMFDSLGAPIDPAGSTWTLSVDTQAAPPDDTGQLMQLDGAISGLTVTFYPANDLAWPLDAGIYFYDLQQIDGSGQICTRAAGEFEVVPDITR
jgi:hypothetical protein